MTPHTYTIDLDWQEGRTGKLYSNNLESSLSVATPPPFPGGIEGRWSPEHLFTAAVSSCFMTTFLAIAENSKLEFSSFQCPAEAILDKKEGKFQITEVHLHPVLQIKEAKDKQRAQRILEKAEAACLITNSIHTKVSMHSKVTV